MKNKQSINRPFLLSSILFVLSIIAFVFIGLLIYTFVFYSETQKGLEIYFADIFAIYPFVLIYISLSFATLVLFLSVVLMWLRKKVGLFLYFSWSLAMVLLLLFAQQIDWLNLLILSAFVVALSFYVSRFESKRESTSPTNLEVSD